MASYEHREIIWVDFGENIGSELAGIHPAIVMDQNNNINMDTIHVLPISSYKGKQYAYDVMLGDIIPSGKISLAKVEQLRTISKQRIKNRGYNNQRLFVSEEHMVAIKREIERKFFGTFTL